MDTRVSIVIEGQAGAAAADAALIDGHWKHRLHHPLKVAAAAADAALIDGHGNTACTIRSRLRRSGRRGPDRWTLMALSKSLAGQAPQRPTRP